MFVQEPIQAAIWHCLNHYAYGDAIFLAERLYAEVNTEDSLYLLATAYYRSGRRLQCYELLKRNENLNSRCRYLMTLCCAELDKVFEAEELLTPSSTEAILRGGVESTASTIPKHYGDSAPFAYQLLGRICASTDRQELAREAYLNSLKSNPFLWDSYCKLCSLGENVDPQEVFQVSHLDNFAMCHGTQNVVVASQAAADLGCGNENMPGLANLSLDKYGNSPSRTVSPIVKSTPVQDDPIVLHPSNMNRPTKYRNLFTSTPTSVMPNFSSTFGFLPIESSPDSMNTQSGNNSMGALHHSPFMVISSSIHELSEPRSKKPCFRVPPSWPQQQQQQQATVLAPSTPAAQVRRSSRLFSNSNVSVKENNKTPPAITRNNTNKSPSRKNRLRSSKSSTTSQENQKNTIGIGIGSGNLNESGVADNQSALIETDLIESRDLHFVHSHPMTDRSIYLSLPNSTAATTKEVEVKGIQMQKLAAEGLMTLLREMGKGYLHLTRYECREAAETFLALKPQHFNTGSVLSLVAKAFFEMQSYEEAVKYYLLMREKEMYRLEGLEWMSTALWHLQKEVELSALAQDLLLADKNNVATWITAGNCFSLQKEHETAILFFKRAIQVDPRFAYAYTLLGHEYVATEELEKAMMSFRNSTRLDPRHYNAWYGMGMIFYKQERYSRAEVYYRKALAIHPNNSVLLCHLGVVQHAEGRTEKSLATFTKALKANLNNPLCKFHRASVLFSVNRLDEALEELEELKQIVPKESLIYFLIAKIHSKKGDTHKALLHFSWATELDPKGANNQIKESIEPILSRSFTGGATCFPAGAGSTTPHPSVSANQSSDMSDSTMGNDEFL